MNGSSGNTKRSLLLFIVVLATRVLAQPVEPDTVWMRTYGPGIGRSVAVTTDGGLVILTRTENNAACQLIRTTGMGDSLWTRRFALPRAVAVIAAQGDSYVLVGYSGHEVLILWTDDAGDSVMQQVHLDSLGEIRGAALCSNGDIVITGCAWGSGIVSRRVLLARIGEQDQPIWWSVFNVWDWGSVGESVVETRDGGLLLSGSTNDVHPCRAFLIKTNSTGQSQWTRFVGQPGSEPAQATGAIQTSDGGYALLSYGGGTYFNMMLTKFTSGGAQQWQQTYACSHGSTPNDVIELTSGGFVLAGWASPDDVQQFCVVGCDSAGTEVWRISLPDSGYGNGAQAIAMMLDSDVTIVGSRGMSDSPSQVFAMRIGDASNNSSVHEPQYGLPSDLSLCVYPNPFNNSTTISLSLPQAGRVALSVHDLLGRQIGSPTAGFFPSGTTQIPFSAEGLATGVYFVRLQFQNQSVLQRIHVLR